MKHKFDNDVLRRAYEAVIFLSWEDSVSFDEYQGLGKEIIELDKEIVELEVVVSDLGSRY